jgi:ubiquitin-activating enzyme E1 C
MTTLICAEDTIDISNLNRQFLFRQADIGKPKAEVAAAFVEKRVKGVKITPFVGKIQDKDEDYYMQFKIIICGLDSIEARRWINATLIGMVDPEDPESLKPLIDGGTEGIDDLWGYRLEVPKLTVKQASKVKLVLFYPHYHPVLSANLTCTLLARQSRSVLSPLFHVNPSIALNGLIRSRGRISAKTTLSTAMTWSISHGSTMLLWSEHSSSTSME